MADIDPDLRDKIIETHTLVKRIDKEQDEHKDQVNGRLKGMNEKIDDHRKEANDQFEKHDARISKNETFRNRVVAYAAAVAGMGALVVELVILGFKKIGGGV